MRLQEGRRAGTVFAHWVSAALLILVLGTPLQGQELRVVGRVKVVSGSAWIVRDGAPTPAHLGSVVIAGDRLETRASGRLGVTFADDTRIALGPDSAVLLGAYLFEPTDERLRFILNVVRGAVAYVSGQIAKYAPDSVHIQTPEAIIGVRGTTLALRVEPS